MTKTALILCAATAVAIAFAATPGHAQTTGAGQPVSVATPTPGPVGTASTSLNTSVTASGPAVGQGSMGTGVRVPASSAAPPIVPGAVTISSLGSSVGSGNVAGSVQINNGGPGSVTGVTAPVSSVPTYVTPGSGLGTPINAGVTVPNPNPGSVQ